MSENPVDLIELYLRAAAAREGLEVNEEWLREMRAYCEEEVEEKVGEIEHEKTHSAYAVGIGSRDWLGGQELTHTPSEPSPGP